MTTIHIQQKLTAEELAKGDQVSPTIYAFSEKLADLLKAFALENPSFRYAVVFGDETTEALGAFGNMSTSLATYSIGLYARAKHDDDEDQDGDDGRP